MKVPAGVSQQCSGQTHSKPEVWGRELRTAFLRKNMGTAENIAVVIQMAAVHSQVASEIRQNFNEHNYVNTNLEETSEISEKV